MPAWTRKREYTCVIVSLNLKKEQPINSHKITCIFGRCYIKGRKKKCLLSVVSKSMSY